MLLSQNPTYKKGFKFEHVWKILKDIEKFTTTNTTRRSPSIGSSSSISAASSFDLNEDIGISVAERPIGVKKAKANLRNEKSMDGMVDLNKDLLSALKTSNDIAANKIRVDEARIRMDQVMEENKFLFMDLNSITDPTFYDYIKNEKERILRKRSEESRDVAHEQGPHGSQYRASQHQEFGVEGVQFQAEGSHNPAQNFGQYYDYLGGTGDDLSTP